MKETITIFIILYFKTLGYSQVYKIFRDDKGASVLISDFKGINFFNYYYSVPLTDFKEKLPDGTWIYYALSPKDSVRKDAENYIRIIGHYKDSLRNGTFKYFSQCDSKKGFQKVETMTYNFKNGKLDGYYASRHCGNEKDNEGFFRDGMKDGFFISYFRERQIESIGLFRGDTLYEWSHYYKSGFMESQGRGEGKFTSGEVMQYDTLGNLARKEFYQNGKLLRYKEFYRDGIIKKESSGEFNICYILGDAAEKDKCLNIPVTGTIIYYTQKGNIAKQERYQQGKLSDTK